MMLTHDPRGGLIVFKVLVMVFLALLAIITTYHKNPPKW